MFLKIFIFVVAFVYVNSTEINITHFRTPKFWNFWPSNVVRFRNLVCTSLDGFDGTCYTRRQCANIDGLPSGSCADGIGSCCVYQRSCGSTSSHNNTYFVNPGYPNTFTGGSSCIFTIKKCSPDICQVRIDFLSLNLAQPDGNGNCANDALVISGGASNIPTICGENSGQHVYVNFDGDSDIRIAISTAVGLTNARSWNLKVSQIACDCPTLAPAGCLMYYTALEGTVNSFNYGTTINSATIQDNNGNTRPGTREMANLNYGVCIQMNPGYCAIEWSEGSDPTAFTVSGNTALAEVDPGLPSNGMTGADCTTDYVVVPNPQTADNSMPVGSDRFCGNQFPTIRTSSKPFVLTVVTNENEITDVNDIATADIANRGFSLNYRQIPCGNTMVFTL